MKLALAGVSHHRAPIELRERVALDLDACRALAAGLGGEAVVLSTCNRVEVYALVTGFHWAFGAGAIVMLAALGVMLALLRKRHVARIEEQAASGEPVTVAA